MCRKHLLFVPACSSSYSMVEKSITFSDSPNTFLIYCSLLVLRREGNRMEMLAIIKPFIPFRFRRCFGLSLHFKSVKKYSLSPSCDNYTWRIWIPFFPSPVFPVLNRPSSSYSAFASIPLNSPYHPTSLHTKASTLLDLNDLNLLSVLKSSLGIWPVSVPCGVSYTLQDKEKGGRHGVCDLLFLAVQPYEPYSWEFESLLSGGHLVA